MGLLEPRIYPACCLPSSKHDGGLGTSHGPSAYVVQSCQIPSPPEGRLVAGLSGWGDSLNLLGKTFQVPHGIQKFEPFPHPRIRTSPRRTFALQGTECRDLGCKGSLVLHVRWIGQMIPQGGPFSWWLTLVAIMSPLRRCDIRLFPLLTITGSWRWRTLGHLDLRVHRRRGCTIRRSADNRRD